MNTTERKRRSGDWVTNQRDQSVKRKEKKKRCIRWPISTRRRNETKRTCESYVTFARWHRGNEQRSSGAMTFPLENMRVLHIKMMMMSVKQNLG